MLGGIGWFVRREAARADRAEASRDEAVQKMVDMAATALPAIESAQQAVRTTSELHTEMTQFLQRVRDESTAEKAALAAELARSNALLERAERTIEGLRR